MKEIWKDVPDYEGLYQVSNLGRIRSYEKYKRAGRHASTYYCPSMIIKSFSAGTGYKRVNLFKDRKGRQLSVHRLVAMAFIPNPENLRCVNHKDENKLNNHADNLEWCTSSYNNQYGSRIERVSKANGLRIAQLDKNDNVVAVYDSAQNAYRKTGIYHSTINAVCSGYRGRRTAGGYKWKRI